MKQYAPIYRSALARVWQPGLCSFYEAAWPEKSFVRCPGPVSAGCGVRKPRWSTVRSSNVWCGYHWCTS